MKQNHIAITQQAFDEQAVYCEQLGSPLTAFVCRQINQKMNWNSPLGQHILDWPGDIRSFGDNVPLRLCGALNWLALTNQHEGVAQYYPPNTAFSDVDHYMLWQAIMDAMESRFEAVAAFMENAPQTNEIRRSAALIPCYHMIARKFGLPLAIHELGASAGLNLLAHDYFLEAGANSFGNPQSVVQLKPDWQGRGPEPTGQVEVASVVGCDIAPINVRDDGEAMRALSYIWPDQRERVERTLAAYDLLRANPSLSLEKADAIDWLESRLAVSQDGVARVFQHTIAWQYFPQDAQQMGEALFEDHGQAATSTSPLARISMESDGSGEGALLRLTIWPDGKTKELARVDFHGRWIRWF